MTPMWSTKGDPARVHALLEACDAYQAAQSGTAAPHRRIETTEHLLRQGAVHIMSEDTRFLGMFTLVTDAPASVHQDFPPAERPARMSRLAVDPELLAAGSLTGVRCVRRAVEVATSLGADVLRAEANPDLRGTRQLLGRLGFEQHGPVHEDETGRHFVHLQKNL